MRRGLPESDVTAKVGGSLRKIRVTWGVTKEAMAGIVPESWLEWGLNAEEDLASTSSEADMLVVHDAVTTISRNTEQKLSKLANQGRHAAHTALLEQLPETSRPPGPGARPRPSPRPARRDYMGQEPLHVFGRGQQTRSVTCLQQSPSAWEGAS